MKNTLRFFGVLDVISIILLSPQIYKILLNFGDIPPGILSGLKVTFTLITYILLFISASGLYKPSKAAIISYYFQFPLRLIVWIFSFGFLTYLSEFSVNELVFEWLFRIVFMLEFFRLYFTFRVHKQI
ncbi:MAG TPA: hypothetical protein VNI52_05680 [Sphingobacteriaceae bacterium]|nr:hypothetical protein [Sphingobacteriaceae bacterium]